MISSDINLVALLGLEPRTKTLGKSHDVQFHYKANEMSNTYEQCSHFSESDSGTYLLLERHMGASPLHHADRHRPFSTVGLFTYSALNSYILTVVPRATDFSGTIRERPRSVNYLLTPSTVKVIFLNLFFFNSKATQSFVGNLLINPLQILVYGLKEITCDVPYQAPRPICNPSSNQ